MDPLRADEIGILPPGALGVAYYHHLSHPRPNTPARHISLWVREGSESGRALRENPRIRIARANGGIDTIEPPDGFPCGLAACAGKRPLPAVFLIATLPDQIVGILKDAVAWLEGIWAAEQWTPPDPPPFPTLILTANGIYFQRVRQVFLELLEEATLLGRLPDLWPTAMPVLVGHLLRGVTLQTGLREETDDGTTLYRPGLPGLTRLAGGSAPLRKALAHRLTTGDLRFADAGDRAPTRVEFDKAIINLVGNLLGMLAVAEGNGPPRKLTIREILQHPVAQEIPTLIGTVLRIGQSVRAYAPTYTRDEAIADLDEAHSTAGAHCHCPSSVQRLVSEFQRGCLQPEIPPTEKWLLDPLLKYARSADLQKESAYLENLSSTLLTCIEQLITRMPKKPA